MAVQEATTGRAWHEIVCDTLKANSVPLVVYVPDNVLTPLIKAVHADSYFTTFPATREEEAVGIVAGAWMARPARHRADADQRLCARSPTCSPRWWCRSRSRLLMIISERGMIGEFNLGQAMVCRTMRPVLDSLGIVHHTITRLDELDSSSTARSSRRSRRRRRCAFILSPLLTGGKVFKAVSWHR